MEKYPWPQPTVRNGSAHRDSAEAGATSDCCAKDQFLALRAAVRDGSARQRFLVGTVLPDYWTDVKTDETFDMPWRIVDYREIRAAPDSELRPAAILLRTCASPNKVAFDSGGKSIFAKSEICAYMAADYEKGCSAEIREVASPIWLPEEKVIAKFFLPSPEELHSNNRGRPRLEELAWEYFRDTPADGMCKKRAFCVVSANYAQIVWLRSRCSSSLVYVVYPNGRVSSGASSSSYNVPAACVIA